MDPQSVLDQLNLSEGIKVADFGCGAGYFSLAAAKKIGQDGIVYSFDILPEKLESVESQARQAGVSNIIIKRADLEKTNGSGLDDESADWVIMKDMLFQNKDKQNILAEAERVLRKKGSALVIEWDSRNFSIGPKPELRVSKEDMIRMAREKGLRLIKEIQAGDFHYGMVFEK